LFQGRTVSQALEFGAVIIREPSQELFEGVNRRSLHPIDSISRRLDFVCTTATDPLQIAAALESDGVNDRIAREEYGFSDVFDLAEELYRRVPLRPPDYVPRFSEPLWRTALGLSRGLMIVPVALILPALTGFFGTRPVAIGLIVALGAMWLWGLLALPRDARLVSQGRSDAARTSLWVSGGLASVASTVVAAALTVIIGGRPGWIIAQMGFSLMLVFGLALVARSQEAWVWLALVPVGTVGGLSLFVKGFPAWASLVGLALSVALILAATWRTALTDTENRATPEAATELRLEFPALLAFGALSFAFLVVLPSLAWGRGNIRMGLAFAWAVLPIIVSAGVLGWGMRRFQRWSRRLLSRVNSPEAFSRKSRLGFFGFLSVSAVVLAGLSLVSFTLCSKTGLNTTIGVTLLAANAVLGLAIAVSLILIGRNRARELLVPWALALVVCIVALTLGWAGLALLNAFLGACALLMIWTTFLVWRSLGVAAG
jgi:hypothetical protein